MEVKFYYKPYIAYQLPDFSGWTKDEVLRFADVNSLKVTFSGEGFVVSQSLAAVRTYNIKCLTKDILIKSKFRVN